MIAEVQFLDGFERIPNTDNLNLNIAPASARFTFVDDDFSGKFGVAKGENVAFSLGFNLSGYYKLSVMDNIEMENIITIYSDYLNKPKNIDIEYQVNIRFKVNKFVKMHLTAHTILDDNASGNAQFRELFGLGLNYSFHDKHYGMKIDSCIKPMRLQYQKRVIN